jgi:hypothetical protein
MMFSGAPIVPTFSPASQKSASSLAAVAAYSAETSPANHQTITSALRGLGAQVPAPICRE